MSSNHWHEEYKRRYAQLKSAGPSFFPYAVFKDILIACVVLGILWGLAYSLGAKLEDLADPTDATYNPRPEWYFLFLFQMLKFFPGRLEPIAAVVLPGLAVLLLALVPLLDTTPERHPLDRPLWTALGVLTLSGIGYLTWAGYRSPLTNPSVEKDPVVSEGQRLYRELRCYYCHAINGKGGRVGPDLAKVADGENEEWLVKHLRDPQTVVPGSAMPKLHLLDEEITPLSAYIKTLGEGALFTEDAPQLFAQHCAACHRLDKQGGDVGPDLSLIGTARDRTYIKRYIIDPARLNANSSMPGFKGQLADVQIEDLARFLVSRRRETGGRPLTGQHDRGHRGT